MIKQKLLLLLLTAVFFSCKPAKETAVEPVSPNETFQQESGKMSDEELQKVLQSEYNPEVNTKISREDMEAMDDLAQEKANLTCKKQDLQKRINTGEQVDPSELPILESLLEESIKKSSKFTSEPSSTKYFEEKFNEYYKSCSN